jgi:hypothetical protein
MKLMFVVELFGGEPMIRQGWGQHGLFFTGEPPRSQSLVTIELPGLKSEKAEAIGRWLIAHNQSSPEDTREDTRLSPALWRYTVLDDFLDAHNPSTTVWHVATHFTADEIATFAEAHAPGLDREVREALAVIRTKRAPALKKVVKRADRIVPIIQMGTRRLTVEAESLQAELDREDVARLATTPFQYKAWVDALVALRSDVVKRELLTTIGKRVVAEDVSIGPVLDYMVTKKLDALWGNELWLALGPALQLPPNTTGAAVDLTKARETTVVMSWDVWKARRIGPVKIGRSALVFHDPKTSRSTYVRGERKLKHAIKRRGGSITRWGNTLTIAAKDPSSVHAALLRVDEIDSLAQLAPARAVALVPEPLPPAHPISTALALATADPRWRRILADLLIERLVGIDADVARRLARAEARANRR